MEHPVLDFHANLRCCGAKSPPMGGLSVRDGLAPFEPISSSNEIASRSRQFRPHLHQDLSEPVSAFAIATIAPVGIVLRMLHYFGSPGLKQLRCESRMLAEFRPHRLLHDYILDLFPIDTQRPLAVAPILATVIGDGVVRINSSCSVPANFCAWK